jgi:hypothetical protein
MAGVPLGAAGGPPVAPGACPLTTAIAHGDSSQARQWGASGTAMSTSSDEVSLRSGKGRKTEGCARLSSRAAGMRTNALSDWRAGRQRSGSGGSTSADDTPAHGVWWVAVRNSRAGESSSGGGSTALAFTALSSRDWVSRTQLASTTGHGTCDRAERRGVSNARRRRWRRDRLGSACGLGARHARRGPSSPGAVACRGTPAERSDAIQASAPIGVGASVLAPHEGPPPAASIATRGVAGKRGPAACLQAIGAAR